MTQSQEHLPREFRDRMHGTAAVLDFLLDDALDGLWFRRLEPPHASWVSPGFWRLMGVDPGAAPAPETAWTEFLGTIDRERLKPFLEGGTPPPSAADACRFTTSAGETVWSSYRHLVLRDQQGNPTDLLVAHRDVTALVTAERAAQSQQKSAAVGKLAAGVAHELNNNLSAVLGNAELLLEDLADGVDRGELEPCVRDIVEGAAKGATLITGLMRYARSPAKGPARTDVGEVVQAIVAVLARSLGSRITLALEMDRDLGEAMVDAERLQTSLVNLALNAQRALDGSGEIRLAARRRLPADGVVPWIELEMTDGGCGMSEAVRARCASAFFTTHADEKAAGLGLASVLAFAREAGGELHIGSREGEGTSVVIALPALTEAT